MVSTEFYIALRLTDGEGLTYPGRPFRGPYIDASQAHLELLWFRSEFPGVDLSLYKYITLCDDA